MLKIYNTYSNSVENFEPIDSNAIKLYVCGPTVYNEIHVGNARSIIVFDLLYRVLKKQYDNVIYTRNITDIDDKIINKANEMEMTSKTVAAIWEESFRENCKILNTLEPTFQPRATETISEIIEAVGTLIDEGFAYFEEGTVFFRISALEEYGKLSKQDNIISGKRIVVSELKEDYKDFVLWKPSKINEPYWNSPFGKGRPGWHIECSAMSHKFLGKRFDIHGGGQDLIFPHHENEQAQNLALFGKFAGPKYWIHNAMVNMGNEKMSKSLGNIVLLSKIFAEYDPLIVRFFILSTHYRHVLAWKDEGLKQSLARFNRWVYHLSEIENDGEILEEFYMALLNDLNMPEAFAIFDAYLEDAIKNNDQALLKKLASTLNWVGLCRNEDLQLRSILEEKLKERSIARAAKDFIRADVIRNEIKEAGYEICDQDNNSFLRKIF